MKILRYINIFVNGIIVIPYLLFLMITQYLVDLLGAEEMRLAFLQGTSFLVTAFLQVELCWVSCRKSRLTKYRLILRYAALVGNLCLVLPILGCLLFDSGGFVDRDYVIVLIALLLLNLAAITESWLAKPAPPADACPHCGYLLTGLPHDSRCPECGWNRAADKEQSCAT